jgi:CDP-diacylglycerol--glycerol-3-phosphate 3-phosphatidyltransferase
VTAGPSEEVRPVPARDRGNVVNIANILSFVRLGLLPFILFFLSSDDPSHGQVAVVCMVVAFATDALDGWFARRLNQVSVFGEILDPIIDKAYTISIGLFLIVFREFPLYVATIILVRDFLILALGSLLFRSQAELPHSNRLGKLTGCIYGSTAIVYTLRLPWAFWFSWVAFGFAILSGMNYLIYFQRRIEKEKA